MFPPGVRALMHGVHPRQRGPTGGREYAILVDVAGESEDRVEGALLRQRQPRKDSTALTIVEIADLQLGMQRFLVVDRYYWTGTPHPQLYSAIIRLAELWAATRIVVDATGVGAGLASFLRRTLGPRVEPFVFSASSKSDLGWGFLGICSSGRFLDYRDDGGPEWRQFWREVEAADYEVVDGPNKRMRWGVADPTVHDDLLMSAALVAVLDQEQRSPYLDAQIIEAADPLAG